MMAEPLYADRTEPRDFDELVKDLDSILDAWFMAEVSRSLEDAHQARAAMASLDQ
jgi:hypothetical protein